MPKPLTVDDLRRLDPALRAWGNTEFQLRHLISNALRDEHWTLFERLSVQTLTCALYRRRGFRVDAEGLCPVYDLLRHGRPMDFDLLHEARHAQSVLQRHYGQARPITRANLDGWLRAMIELANTVGTYEAHTDGPHRWQDSGPLFATPPPPFKPPAPFTIPPGPFEALRGMILGTMEDYPPLLATLAVLNALQRHEAVFPNALDLAALVLAPGLLSFGFGYAPLAICAVGAEDDWATLDGIERRTVSLRASLDEICQKRARLYESMTISRSGGHLSASLDAIMAEPIFTAQSLAARIGSVPRTTEKLVIKLSQAHVISAFQRQGRLTIWKLS